MKKTVLAMFAILFLVLAGATFAQSPAPGDPGTRPGPGYGMGPGGGYGYGPGYGYGMGPGMMGPGYGYGYGMGPGMMGPGWGHGYGMGPGMMGPGYGYGWGPGMMGPGYGYGRGGGESYADLSPEEREARAKAFVQEYIRRYLPGYSLEKKEPAKKK